MPRLVTLLLQAGVLSPERAREAHAHQIVFGDRLGTNLLALGYLPEATIAQALAMQHGVPWAAGADATTRPALTRTLPRQLAAQYAAVPARVDDDGVVLFMMDPTASEALQALAHHYRRPVRGVVVCEARMWALLHRFYLVRRGMRALKLDDEPATVALRPRSAERAASSVATTIEVTNPGLRRPTSMLTSTAPTAPVEATPVVAAVAAVAPVPSAAPVTPAPVAAVAADPSLPALVGALAPLQPPLGLRDDVDAPGSEPPSFAPSAAGRSHAATMTLALSPDDEVTDDVAPTSLRGEGAGFAEADVPLDELAMDLAVLEDQGERTPLSFAEARQALAGVTDRRAIARIVLRFAMTRARRAVLLTVQGSEGARVALGWDALGDGLAPDVIPDLVLPLDEPSAFQLAREARGHVLGPLARTAVNDEFLRLLGGGAPRTAFIGPILARGKVINLLYVDDGPGRLTSPDIGELLILCQHINKSYDALLQRAALLPGG